MLILIATIMYLNRKHKKEIEFRDNMIRERDREIAQLRKERFNLKMDIISNNTGKDNSYLKY